MASIQTYCTRNHIIDLIGEAGLLTCIDDNANGQEEATESVFLDNAISRAATEMNAKLRHQYNPLSALANNEWCVWCNAYIAVYFLQSRRSNSPAAAIMEAVQAYRETLEDIRWGRDNVPEQAPTHNSQPSVTNFNIRFNDPDGPVLVDPDQSTGGNPVPGISRKIGNQFGINPF